MAGLLNVPVRLSPKNLNCFTRQFSNGHNRKILAVLRPQSQGGRCIRATLLCAAKYNKSVLHSLSLQSRNFRTSFVLCEDKIVNCPAFPESVAEGDLRWEKAVGDSVSTDEVVAEIETDKTAIPVPSPANGVIVERYVDDGATVKAGQKLFKLQLGAGGGAPPAKAAAAPPPTPSIPSAPPPPSPPKEAPTPQPPKTAPLDKPPSPPPPRPPPSMPVAAIKHAQAVEAAVVKVPPEDPTKEISGTRTEYRIKMNRMRQRIAQRLKEAQNTNAMLTTFNEIDMSAIIEFRKSNQDAFTKKHGIKLGFMSAFVKAAAYALQDQPVVNAVIDGNEIVYRDYIDISVAVATPKGLVVPVVRNVENMNYADIEKAINALGEKARTGKLAVEDMDGGTFTISNGGVFGSLMGTPIINPPQSAILGMHATFDRPVALKGQIPLTRESAIGAGPMTRFFKNFFNVHRSYPVDVKNMVVIRPMMYIALTYDHRLIDGREAVLFLRKIKAAVEDPRIIVAGL